MTFAICLQLPNFIHFGNTVSIWAELIPQILFLHSIFGYLAIMIVAKWATDWTSASTNPPNLLNMLIYMFLKPGTVDEKEQMYHGQGFVQQLLLYVALVCIPWMLLTKPYMLWREHQKKVGSGYRTVGGNPDEPREDEERLIQHEEEGEGHEEGGGEEHVSAAYYIMHAFEY